MSFYTFDDFLSSNLDVDAKAIARLTQSCQRLSLKKGEFALRVGERCRHSFYIEKGLLKEYTVDDKGKEHILLFAPEHWFAANIETVHFSRPADYFMEALEDTQVLLLDQHLIDQLGEEFESFRAFNEKLLHQHIQELQHRVTQLLGASARDRYLDFVERYPHLTVRLSQVQIAAYLGITPEGLSRVRRELAQQAQR